MFIAEPSSPSAEGEILFRRFLFAKLFRIMRSMICASLRPKEKAD